MQVQVRRAWHMLPLLQDKLLGVSSILAAMAMPRRCPRPSSPLSMNAVRDQYLSRPYLNVSDPVYGLHLWCVTTFRVTFLSVTHHVRTYVRTHIRTYVLCQNRSLIQSLALMRSAISDH